MARALKCGTRARHCREGAFICRFCVPIGSKPAYRRQTRGGKARTFKGNPAGEDQDL